MTDSDRSRRRRIAFFSLGAFVIYGAWACFANRSHGLEEILSAGFTQGLMSLLSTALLTSAMEKAFVSLAPGKARFFVTGLIPITLVTLLMYGVHAVAGTPEVLPTIMPSAVFGGLYSISYTFGLTRLAAPEPADS